MTEHVYLKYPNRVGLIKALRNKNTQFSEICDDYNEMCTWLAAQARTLDPHDEEFAHAKEIIRDLEDEIETALREAGL